MYTVYAPTPSVPIASTSEGFTHGNASETLRITNHSSSSSRRSSSSHCVAQSTMDERENGGAVSGRGLQRSRSRRSRGRRMSRSRIFLHQVQFRRHRQTPAACLSILLITVVYNNDRDAEPAPACCYSCIRLSCLRSIRRYWSCRCSSSSSYDACALRHIDFLRSMMLK